MSKPGEWYNRGECVHQHGTVGPMIVMDCEDRASETCTMMNAALRAQAEDFEKEIAELKAQISSLESSAVHYRHLAESLSFPSSADETLRDRRRFDIAKHMFTEYCDYRGDKGEEVKVSIEFADAFIAAFYGDDNATT